MPYNITIDRIVEEIDAFDDEELFPSSETLEEEVGGVLLVEEDASEDLVNYFTRGRVKYSIPHS